MKEKKVLILPDSVGVNVGEIPGRPSLIVLSVWKDGCEILIAMSASVALETAGNLLDAGRALDGFNNLTKTGGHGVN